ncbi:TonB-dependent receptor [Pedobacter sp. BS3]|uniref:TonB-dependent receptor n=1 Tax=Pedobacter sp. BS3 TaxID=2567937 RepID=UPI0011EDA92F|nr:TonB-dependent receptor [Pedobacter sp. BS3]TZF82238.1 TonB-dependent receptor [Pedobacter sp. BS3]
MKITGILLLVACLQVSATAYSQQVSLDVHNAKLENVFDAIRQQTGYNFLYKNEFLNKAKPVTITRSASLPDILGELFRDQPLTYSIMDKTILVKRKPLSAASTEDVPAPVRDIRGKVTDSKGEPLPGASVRLKGTSVATQTNSNGEFILKTAVDKPILVITYTGFISREVAVTPGQTMLNITLTEDLKNLQEVVVIGYGTVKKSDLTGAVSVVKTEDIENIPVPRVDQMLQGRIAGAEIVSTTGEPGAGTSIRIRGTRSITATNEPLFVVDGVMDAINDLNDLNPSDIESIQVLKDASSTAIYGSRGSNGVIVITTKSGRSDGKTNFSFRTDVGASQLPRYLDLMNATEFAELQNDRYYFASTANQIKPLEQYPYPDPASLGEGTNWTKEITHTAPYQNYTLSASGGNKSTKYYFSGNFNNNQGIVINSGMQRYQVRLNLDQTFSKYVKAGLRLNYSYINQALNKADIGTQTLWYRSTIFLAPTIAAYKPDGSFNDWNTQWYSGTLFDSPLANSKLQRKDQIRKSLSPMLFVEVNPIKELTIRSSVSLFDYNRFDDNFYPGTLPTRASKNTGAYAYKSGYRANNILNENTVSYKKTWDKVHHFDALYGFTYQSSWNANLYASGDGYFVDDINTNDLAAIPSKETLNAGSGYSDQRKISNLARINYNYASKYYLTLTGRVDAASNFAADHKWAFFPSAAVKWNLKKENFLKNVKAIDELAIRLSGGVSGNDAISNYQSLSQLASSSSGYLFDGAIPVSYYPSRIANEGLTWEKTASYNAGLDLSILNNRFDFTLDVYQSKTSDLLLTVQLPTQTGYNSRIANIGKTSNKGVELTINSNNIRKPKFSWSTSLTLAHNDQMVNDIGGLDRIPTYINPYGAQYMMYGYVQGRPLNALWGMQYAGVWKTQAEIDQNAIDKKYASASTAYYTPGRQRYIDQNHDGVLNNDDLVYLGNADPYLYGGLQNTFKIKRFYVSFYFNYSLGGKIYNPTELFMGTGTYLSNQYRYMVNAWHPVRNPNSDYPRADSKDDIPNDRFVHSATFLRLKNASVSYSFDLAKATKNKLNSLTLTASGNNLYLWKYYNGYDPEVSTEASGSTIRRMDNGAYPNSRTVTFSAELKF